MISRRSVMAAGMGSFASASVFRSESGLADVATFNYPARPVAWVVPYAAGGATDVLSRMVCQQLQERLGQSFIVDNKPGAGSNIGTQTVINAMPDGYTLLLTSTANAINASFDPMLTFNFTTAIQPIAGLARIPLVLVVNNDLPVHTIPEFIAYAKTNPGKLNIASSGIGTSLHLCGELFKSMAGVEFAHVPYRGSAPGLTDVMSGEIQGMFDNVTSSFPLVRSGKMRALGVTTMERSVTIPDVPPISDSLPGYEGSSFYGLGAPARTPMPIVDLLNKNVNDIVALPSIRKQFDELGAIPLPGSSAQFTAMLQVETERWRKVVTSAHLRKE